MLEKASRILLSDTVYRQIRAFILAGDAAPGERLVETDLARTLGTSKVPVREALVKLEQEGLVMRYPHRGTYVREFTSEDLTEILIVRRVLDEQIMRMAVSHVTEEMLSELEADVVQMEKHAADRDATAFQSADAHFHQTICDSTGQTVFSVLWSVLYVAMVRAMVLASDPDRDDLTSVARNHRLILEALRSRDAELAVAASDEHMRWWFTDDEGDSGVPDEGNSHA